MENRSIVIIEDEQEISELIQNQIAHFGYKITPFYDGKKALDFIQTEDHAYSHAYGVKYSRSNR